MRIAHIMDNISIHNYSYNIMYTTDDSDFSDEEEDIFRLIRYNNMICKMREYIYINIKLLGEYDNNNTYFKMVYRDNNSYMYAYISNSRYNFLTSRNNYMIRNIIDKDKMWKYRLDISRGIFRYKDTVYSCDMNRTKYLCINNNKKYIIRDNKYNIIIYKFLSNKNKIEYYDINRGHIIIINGEIIAHHIGQNRVLSKFI